MLEYKNPSFMILPTMSCQANCNYCFGPFKGATMSKEVAEQSVDFINSITTDTKQNKASITFHGGEPLLAPISIWQYLLKETESKLTGKKISWNIQSNLWNLDDEFATLFREHNVSIGTSIDGDQRECDVNRGYGYWQKTMNGIAKAREYGLDIGGIATISRKTKENWKEVVDFFIQQQINMNLHPALSSQRIKDDQYALSVDEYSSLIKEMYPYYIKHRKNISISTLDTFCKSCVNGNADVCSFQDCLGMFLVIDPSGNIYSCQRFCGNEEFSLGNVADRPSLEDLFSSKAASHHRRREEEVSSQCGECEYFNICRGGCYYNAAINGDGVIDPLCEAYKESFSFVQKQLVKEMGKPENMDAIIKSPAQKGEHPLFRKGHYISLAQEVHPKIKSSHARTVLAMYELGKSGDPETAARNVVEQGICGNLLETQKVMTHYFNKLQEPATSLNNIYIHLTSSCNLTCTHCYATSDDHGIDLDVSVFKKIIEEDIVSKFNKVVVLGGEPLILSNKNSFFKICKQYKDFGGTIVLRTNLTGAIETSELLEIADSFSQVVVSIDGNEKFHDNRRGEGTYKSVVHNLEMYRKISQELSSSAELSIACTMREKEIEGEVGQSVRELGEKLGNIRVRFNPLLPLGRAKDWDEPLVSEELFKKRGDENLLNNNFYPVNSCGIGQNLYIKANGDVFPCYACDTPNMRYGSIYKNSISSIAKSSLFKYVQACTVNSISKCKDCPYRYLCGGACLAWKKENNFKITDAPDNCIHLQKRAKKMIDAARTFLLDDYSFDCMK